MNKSAKQAETIISYQNQVLIMVNHCLEKSQINSIPELRVLSFYNFSLQNEGKSSRVPPVRAKIIHSQSEIEVLFSTLKNSPLPLVQSIY